jgi:hypothetical protein
VDFALALPELDENTKPEDYLKGSIRNFLTEII